MLKLHDHIFIRLDTIPERDGRKDGQTDGIPLDTTAVVIASNADTLKNSSTYVTSPSEVNQNSLLNMLQNKILYWFVHAVAHLYINKFLLLNNVCATMTTLLPNTWRSDIKIINKKTITNTNSMGLIKPINKKNKWAVNTMISACSLRQLCCQNKLKYLFCCSTYYNYFVTQA